jgi:DNA-directed RNA polymerase specialized sigma24 family protein
LRRVRQNAGKFEAAKGTPTQWVIGNAQYAFVEVAKAVVSARRSKSLEFVDPDDLLSAADPCPTTEEHVLRKLENAEALADAAARLSEHEFAALRLRVTLGYSRAEVAELLFGGSDTKTRKNVDRLVERGLRKLAVAWADRKTSRGTVEGITVSTRSDDKEETDE